MSSTNGNGSQLPQDRGSDLQNLSDDELLTIANGQHRLGSGPWSRSRRTARSQQPTGKSRGGKAEG